MTDHHVRRFDQANLQSKLRRYLPHSVELRSASHEVDGQTLVVVYVAPHPDGFVVFEADGTYSGPDGRERFEFRAGEVFFRHGSASERWRQSDIATVREGILQRERENWRREFRDDLAATVGTAAAARDIAAGPAGMLDWRLDEEALVGAVIEQIRRDDRLPLELLLLRLPAEAREAVGQDDRERLGVIVDRIAAIAATLVLADLDDRLDRAVAALVAIYNAGYDERGMPRGGPGMPSAVIWLDVITRVFAIGAFAVRRRNW